MQATISCQEAVLRAAKLFTFVREEPKGSNAGQAVEAFQKHTGNSKGEAWCCSFVMTVLDGMVEHPLTRTGSCANLGAGAKEHGLLHGEPVKGAIFLLWFPSLGRFAHTGFLLGKNDDGSWNTIEGNSNPDGSREGYGVFVREKEHARHFGPKDAFIWWW